MLKIFERNKVKFSLDILSLAELIYPILHKKAHGIENAMNWKDLIPMIQRLLSDFEIKDRDIRKAKEALLNGFGKPVVSYGKNGVFVARTQGELDLFIENQTKYAKSAYRNIRSAKRIQPELEPFPKEDDGFFGFMKKDK